MKKIVIQAGFPKCGSTSIFAALKQNVPLLEKNDIFILSRPLRLHRTRRVPVAPHREFVEALGSPEAAETVKAGLIRAVHDCPEGGTVVICSEVLADPRKAWLFSGLERLCDIELVFYFRPQAQWIASAWKQWELKSGQRLPAALQSSLANSRPDYLGSVRGWESAVPGIRITPRPLLRACMVNGEPSYDFLHLLGLDLAKDAALEQRANPSLDYSLLHLLQRNSARIFMNRHDNAPFRNLLKDLPTAYHRTNIPMLDQGQCDLVARHFHADNVTLVHHYMGMAPDAAEQFVQQHFHETVTGRAFPDLSEQEILERAAMILKEVTGKTGDPDQLLLEYLARA